MVTCPYLFELDTIAYFAILRNYHSFQTVARIRETTQLLLDVYDFEGNFYVHPLKVWRRYSPTMFLPHLQQDHKFSPVISNIDAMQYKFIICRCLYKLCNQRHPDYVYVALFSFIIRLNTVQVLIILCKRWCSILQVLYYMKAWAVSYRCIKFSKKSPLSWIIIVAQSLKNN